MKIGDKAVQCGLVLVVLLGCAVAEVEAQFMVAPAVNYAAGNQPSGIAAGDYDGDGDVDLATTVDLPDRIVVLLNDGSGLYMAGPVTLLPATSSPQDLIAGDLDGDGDTDLAVALRDPQGQVVTMLNNGAGTFVSSGSAVVGARPRGLSIGDIDGDGDADLAVANRDSNTASVLTNNGAGGFTVQTLAAGGEPRDTAFGDFDGDTDLDLAVTNSDDRTVGLYTNAAGTYSASGTLSVGPLVRPDGITAGNLDGTGPDDLAVATSDQTLNINQATVFTNAAGVFAGPFNYSTSGSNTSDIIAADLDCDGALDLITSNSDSNDVSLLENLGAGTYGPATVLAAGTSPQELDAADLDADGDPDFAVANRDSGDVSVFINNTCDVPVCQNNLDCDDGNVCNGMETCDASGNCQPGVPLLCDDGDACTTDSCDPLAGCVHVPVVCPPGQSCNPATGQCEAADCPADLNGDGVVDAMDLALLLGSWGPCN